MEITNICPYCGGEMREGALPAYKYALRWCPSDERGGIEEEKSVRLSGTPVLESVYAPALYCESCCFVQLHLRTFPLRTRPANGWIKRSARSATG